MSIEESIRALFARKKSRPQLPAQNTVATQSLRPAAKPMPQVRERSREEVAAEFRARSLANKQMKKQISQEKAKMVKGSPQFELQRQLVNRLSKIRRLVKR